MTVSHLDLPYSCLFKCQLFQSAVSCMFAELNSQSSCLNSAYYYYFFPFLSLISYELFDIEYRPCVQLRSRETFTMPNSVQHSSTAALIDGPINKCHVNTSELSSAKLNLVQSNTNYFPKLDRNRNANHFRISKAVVETVETLLTWLKKKLLSHQFTINSPLKIFQHRCEFL